MKRHMQKNPTIFRKGDIVTAVRDEFWIKGVTGYIPIGAVGQIIGIQSYLTITFYEIDFGQYGIASTPYRTYFKRMRRKTYKNRRRY